ncbi:hypothetical protein E4T44_01701 [Aureobasidium sp. EXF-8845]|nr:hypothetical protein E4T44_01701 [Aureobasidium sp. EXF-8845]KAI4856785.1 hypothetical protein E4T45_01740 [Aureobasidium sp. EXF-8846]
MVGKYTFVSCCIAALSAVTYGIEYAPGYVPPPTTIWDRVDLPFTFTDCAAPTEMETCWNAQNSTAKYINAYCFGMQNKIDCALTNCWNRVYSCDYQQLLLSYNYTCSVDLDKDGPGLDLPFYPAPANAAESCSCDLKKMDNNLDFDDDWDTCAGKVRKQLSEEDYEHQAFPDCDCCAYGAYAAGVWDTCKDADPNYIILDWAKFDFIDDHDNGNNNSLAQCSSRLQNFNCVDYGFSAYGVNASDFAKPTPLHSATGTWSDTNGILTAPVSGTTYTWTAWNETFTGTAASVEAMATRSASTTGQTTSSATGKDAGSMTGSITGSATGSVTGAASGASGTSTGAAPTMMAAQYPAAALMGLGGLAFALL